METSPVILPWDVVCRSRFRAACLWAGPRRVRVKENSNRLTPKRHKRPTPSKPVWTSPPDSTTPPPNESQSPRRQCARRDPRQRPSFRARHPDAPQPRPIIPQARSTDTASCCPLYAPHLLHRASCGRCEPLQDLLGYRSCPANSPEDARPVLATGTTPEPLPRKFQCARRSLEVRRCDATYARVSLAQLCRSGGCSREELTGAPANRAAPAEWRGRPRRPAHVEHLPRQ